MAGKGDKPRPTKKSQYNANYDLIKWGNSSKSKQVKKIKNKTVYVY